MDVNVDSGDDFSWGLELEFKFSTIDESWV